uniref:Polyprenol-phosphate-mannose--protein mannosyltransferase n=1 Tax=uncultured bacterium 5H7 TaxID=1701327 RepID=A0A0N9HML6_9BACT|nr:dolichyl-phosphate-mannose--protein O-mannosyl transferase [uncultured bacterium 5H7]
MTSALAPQRDPLGWTILIAMAFLALCWHRLGIPARIYFDEVHYVPAARKLLAWTRANPEHPLLAKQAIAGAIALFGDRPLVWRIPSALFGTLGIFAFGRALWWASGRRFAALAGMVLLATGFLWFIQSRIAMLDMVMAGLGMTALWLFTAATRLPPAKARWRLAGAGICFGLALGAKWSIAPVAALTGLVFLAVRLKAHGRRFLTRADSGPVRGISLIEATFWLGSVPLAVYWLTYWPAFLYAKDAVDPLAPVAWHRYMLQLQDSVTRLHPYRSVWYQWVADWRAVWYLYDAADGVQRGIVLVGNPFSMLAGLPAILWCLWAGLWRRRHDALACALLYLSTLGMWIVSGKPIQFYYHYLLPSTFLLACLALALDAIWQRGGRWRWLPLGALAASLGMFVYFYPIISAAELHGGRNAYVQWMWLRSWR